MLIDTSFIVSLINARDEQHEKPVKLSKQYDETPVIVTDALILEVGKSFSRNFKQECIRTVEGFLKFPKVEIVRLDQG